MKINGQVEIDSYDSRIGVYSSQSPGETTIYSDEDLTMQAGASIQGNIVSEGDVEVKKDDAVSGTVHYGGTIDPTPPSTHYGSASAGATVPPTSNVNGLIDDKISESAAPDNDNPSEESTLEDIEDQNCGESAGSACKLTPGTYRMDSFELKSRDQIHFNTNGRTINLVLTAPQGTTAINMKSNSLLKVNGDGRVNIYTRGNTNFDSRAKVLNDDQDATRFWLYQRDDSEIDIGSQADYVGVFYAPGDPGGQIELRGNGQSAIYGAAVGDIAHANAGKKIHFDRALMDASATGGGGGGGSTSSTVAYLDVTLSEVQVSD
jgi:hypothetical protein